MQSVTSFGADRQLASNLEAPRRLRAAATAISLFLAAPAFASQATTADLLGKKICWDNGLISTYSPGGKYYSTYAGNGTWRATSVGVEIHAEHYSGFFDADKKPDGSFYSGTEHAAGHYCK
jgi:hypothetical protein